MDALLRQLKSGADGIAEYRDIEVSVDALTMGSAPDRTIQLLGEQVAGESPYVRILLKRAQASDR